MDLFHSSIHTPNRNFLPVGLSYKIRIRMQTFVGRSHFLTSVTAPWVFVRRLIVTFWLSPSGQVNRPGTALPGLPIPRSEKESNVGPGDWEKQHSP